MQAGRLDKRLQFQAPHELEDGAGNYTSGYSAQYECAASITPLRGGEDVLAARLEQRGPAIVTVRNSVSARRITHDWRAVDMRNGRVYAIKESPRESSDRAFLEMLVVSGAIE